MGDRYIVYNNKLWKPYKTFEYTGEPEEFTLPPDTYLFVADGAKGGCAYSDNIAYGGTTYGILDLDHTQTMYAVVGGNGEDPHNRNGYSDTTENYTRAKGGYNGGGNGGLSWEPNVWENGAAGGGATDVRLSSNEYYMRPQTVHSIPEGYDQVSYIHGNKQQCIIVDYEAKFDTRIEVLAYSNPDTIDRPTNGASETLFCCNNVADAGRFIFQLKRGNVSNRNMYFCYGTDYGSFSAIWESYTIHKVSLEYDNGEVHYTDESLFKRVNGSTSLSPDTTKLSILGQANETTRECSNMAKASIFYVKVFEDGNVLSRYLVPYCKHATDASQIDVSSVVWHNKYYDNTETLHYIHTESYIPIDPDCEGIRVHVKLTGKEEFIIRVDYYDSNYTSLGQSGYGITYMPYGNFRGMATRKQPVYAGDMNIYPPFAEARYIRIVLCHPTDDLDVSMVEEFSLTYLTYEGGYEAGLYDLIEGKKYPCETNVKMYYGSVVEKTVWKSRYEDIKYAKMVVHRTRNNSGKLGMTCMGFGDIYGNMIPMRSVSAIRTDGSAVTYSSDSQTIDNLIVDDTSIVSITNWNDTTTDVVITFEFTEAIPSYHIVNQMIKPTSESNYYDPYEWEIFISPDNETWYPFTRRLYYLSTNSNDRKKFAGIKIYQPDSPFNLALYTRIFVAGGAGGSPVQWGYNNSYHYQEFVSFGGGAVSGWVQGPGNAETNNIGLSASQDSGFSFGRGRNADDKIPSGATHEYWNVEGQGGGGGGWYGGYSIANQPGSGYGNGGCSTGGSGGSSYVLTESSYKPTNYMLTFEDVMPTLYFRDFLMLPGQAFDGPMLTIYKEADYPTIGSKIIMPYVGNLQPIDFLPGQYRIRCYGGHGGCITHFNECGAGGYAEGVMNLNEPTEMYGYVGNSAYLVGMNCNSEKHDTIFNNRVLFKSASYGYSTGGEGAASGGGAVDLRLIRDDIPTVVGHSVPDGYSQLEYIENTSYGTINTGYHVNPSTNIECVFYGINMGLDGPAVFGVCRDGLTFYQRYYYTNNIVFGCDRGRFEGSSVVPFYTKIKITVIGTVLTVTDMSGNVLGTITGNSRSETYDTGLYIFDSGSPYGDYGEGFYCGGRLYYFKIYEGDELVRWFVPFKNDNDSSDMGLYDIINGTKYAFSSTSVAGPVLAEKDVYYTTEYPIQDSLLSRIIVAGGGGGASYENGQTNYYGGAGGGTSGGSVVGSGSGTNNGPGTQTETPAQTSAGGGFGYGGVGVRYSGSTPGCGGGGWYGGNGTAQTSSGNPRAGSGGSGYVLTDSSYKPSGYIPDTRFWMTDAQLVRGGNTKRGMTRIEIDVEKITAVYILAQDADSYKAYNADTNEWDPIEISELTPEIFDEYSAPISSIISDVGLLDAYKFYVYDKYNIGIDAIKGLVVPIKQHVILSEHSNAEILDKTFDADRDENVTIDMDYTVTGIAENRKLNVDISFDMTDVPATESTVYVVQFKTRMKPTSYYYPTKPEKTIDELKLLRVGTGDTVPNRYKTHIGSFMPDGVTAISAVQDSVSCEYKRNIYTASLLNNSVIRITRFNIIENKSYIVRDNIPVTDLDPSNTGCCGGGILVNDDYIYLSNSSMINRSYLIRILRIPIDPSQPWTAYATPANNTNYYVNAYGKMEWVSPTMILLLTQYGFVKFNTLTNSFTFVPDTDTSGGRRNDFSVGKYTVITYGESSTIYGPRVYDKDTLERISFSTEQWAASYEPGIKCVCYDDGKFYITQAGHLYIVSDNPSHNLTVPDEHILTPYTSFQPKTISVSNGLIYVTIAGDTSTYYIYNMNVGQWISTSLPFATGAFSNTSWYRPACFLGFFFIGNLKLYVANFNNYTKYKVGQKSNVWMIQTNDSFHGSYTYDERFISIDNTGIHFNTGYIEKQLTCIDETNGIYQSENFIKNSEYKQIISYGFTTSGEEEEESNG